MAALVDMQQFSKHKDGIKSIFMVAGILCWPLHNSQGYFSTIFTKGTPPQKLQTDWEKVF